MSAIPSKARHQWFRSFKSSQALTQSVFAALDCFGRLDLLEGVIAECGRPAFLEDARSASLVLEHEVRSLGEPRRTSVDVFLDAHSRRVAVECKLTERKFGVCSRPQLRPDAPSYAEQHCDGNYHIQRGRSARCALTEIGVRYWTYLPHLFDWATDGDLWPCPFSEVYQLARNALAATVSERGFDPDSGHVLVVYDARNPEFAADGEAGRQYESAISACRVPGLIRRLSWQRLVNALTCAPELAYLLAGLEGKYGIRPGVTRDVTGKLQFCGVTLLTGWFPVSVDYVESATADAVFKVAITFGPGDFGTSLKFEEGRDCPGPASRHAEDTRLDANPPPSSCEEIPGQPPSRRWPVRVQPVGRRCRRARPVRESTALAMHLRNGDQGSLRAILTCQ